MPKNSDKKLRGRQTSGADENVYLPNTYKDKGAPPHCIYFYYVKPLEMNGDKAVRPVFHYYHAGDQRPLERDDVEFITRELTLNARIFDQNKQAPPPDGKDLEYVVWTRKCYVVVVFDDQKAPPAKGRRVTFETKGDSLPNHTFFDAWDFDVDLDKKPLGAVGAINHMKKNIGGDELKRGGQRFRFCIDPDGKDGRFPDSGGTNMGPPVPPP